jgi:hypothetical protein
VEARGGLSSTLACFPFALRDGAVPGLIALVLILSTPTLGEVTVAAVFDTAVPMGAPAPGGILAPGEVLAFSAVLT